MCASEEEQSGIFGLQCTCVRPLPVGRDDLADADAFKRVTGWSGDMLIGVLSHANVQALHGLACCLDLPPLCVQYFFAKSGVFVEAGN